jgi:hypothetical protein
MLQAERMSGCSLSIKIHLLHSNFNFVPANFGYVSDKYSEKDLPRYFNPAKVNQVKWNPTLLAHYCWQFKREPPDTYKRKSSGKRF